MSDLATRRLARLPDTMAPDGTAVRLLCALGAGSMAHFELAAGEVSAAVAHRTVEEIWYVLGGRGELWRRRDGREQVETIEAGISLTIPLGTAFQFRAAVGAPLAFVAVTMPPWPGADEAVRVEGPWRATAA